MPRSSAHDSTYSWFRLSVSLLIAVIGSVGMWAIVIIMPMVQHEFQVDRADASLPFTLTMIGFGLGNVLIGRMVDRFGATKSIIAAALLGGLGFTLATISSSIYWLSAAQFLVGLGNAACFGPIIADVSHWFKKRRGLAVSIVASGNYLSGGILPLFFTDIAVDSGWRTACFLLAAMTVSLMIPLAFFLRRQISKDDQATEEQASSLKAASLPYSPRTLQWMLGFAGIGCCIAMAMPQVHIVALCVDLGYGPAVGGEMLSLMLFGGVLSRILSGILADHLGGVRTLLIGAIAQCIALFLYLPYDGLVSLYVVSLIFGLSQGGIVPAYAIIVREYMPAREAGARVGFVIMLTIIGMALGGWLSGVIYDLTRSYDMAFIHGIAWNFLTIGIMALILFNTRTAKPVPT